ncbi:MAG TPA: cupin domain-containing protein [Alphaproteobacteria bacterium]
MQIRAIVVAIAALAALAAGNVGAQSEAVKRTVLQQSELAGMAGHQGVLYRAELGPGAAAPKHTHPGDEFLYIAEGTVIIQPDGKQPVTLKAGDSIHMPMGTAHTARNPDSSARTVVIAFLVSESGKPLASVVE